MKKSTFGLLVVLCNGLIDVAGAQTVAPTYEQAIAESTQSIEAKDFATAQGKAEEALKLAQSPEETGNALMLLGNVFEGRDMMKEAIEQWKKAADLADPEDTGFPMQAHLRLAFTYARQREAEKAIPEFKSVLASLDAEIGDLDDALATIDKEAADEMEEADLSPEKLEAMTKTLGDTRNIISLGLANSYFGAQKFDLARKQFNETLRSDGCKPDASSLTLIRLGQIDIVEKNPKAALSKFDQALNIKGIGLRVKKLVQEEIKAMASTNKLSKVSIDENKRALDRAFDYIVLLIKNETLD